MDQNELRKKTIAKLQELFQLDQPDLDFGFYRVMHVKANEISKFIKDDLLKTIQTAFDAATTERARLIGADQVYTHLYRFFSRYYDSGDFVSMRYHARETSSVAKPYAIPYGGEEVMLYWANADQYYIKTTENFRDFTFDPAAAPEIQNLPEDQRNLILGTVAPGQYKVHFTIVDADQGEHGNIKSADDSKREFFLAQRPVSYENGELVVRFEYRTPGDGDQISEAREKQLQERFGFTKKSNLGLYNAAAEILDALATDASVPEPYSVLLNVSAPLESVKKRPLLAKYLNKYTAANKSDYFIHKNLRAFLRRELDFYIKNEIMNLDDVETADASVVENMLDLIKVFRKIAGKLIDFLGQLEDFQKRLWLKKKFVVECNYCITLDRIRKASEDDDEWRRSQRDRIMTEILSNERQVAEWERLGFDVSRVKLGGGGGPGSSQNQQLALDEMESAARDPNDYLMVDTQFFTPEFKKRLLSFIPDFDAQCDGLLIHSENFQALNLLQERYREQVKCIYIDPPYNTGFDGFIYRDNFQHSNWLSMLEDRVNISKNLMNLEAPIFISIDDNEIDNLKKICDLAFGINNFVVQFTIASNSSKNNSKFVSITHEYLLCYAINKEMLPLNWKVKRNATEEYIKRAMALVKMNLSSDQIHDELLSLTRYPRFYEFDHFTYADNVGVYQTSDLTAPSGKNTYDIIHPVTKKPCNCGRRGWAYSEEIMQKLIQDNMIAFGETEETIPRLKNYLMSPENLSVLPKSVLFFDSQGSTKWMKMQNFDFDFPKAIEYIKYIISMYPQNDALILDFFAGSGTTAHAVINLNREDGGSRKYILVEMGAHFDTVLKPRIEKVVYSPDWKDGKPTSLDKGVSHCFKYIRLESYEDTLNNLELPKSDPIASNSSLPSSLREEYMLRYLLETESRDSLCNLDMFANPFGEYKLNIKRPGSEASESTPVDLVETFNYLIGLRVTQYYMPLRYSARFKRAVDPELPGEEGSRRLVLDGKPKRDDNGKWRFECIEGVVPAHPLNPNNGQTKRVLIIWRNLTGDLERDNAVLDWLADDIGFNDKVPEYDVVYVNGCNNLGADRKETDSYQVRLIEEEFFRKMWG